MARKLKIAIPIVLIALQVFVTAVCALDAFGPGSNEPPPPDTDGVETGFWMGVTGMLGLVMTLILARRRGVDWPTAACWGMLSDIGSVCLLLPVLLGIVAVSYLLHDPIWIVWTVPVISALLATLCLSLLYRHRKPEA